MILNSTWQLNLLANIKHSHEQSWDGLHRQSMNMYVHSIDIYCPATLNFLFWQQQNVKSILDNVGSLSKK